MDQQTGREIPRAVLLKQLSEERQKNEGLADAVARISLSLKQIELERDVITTDLRDAQLTIKGLQAQIAEREEQTEKAELKAVTEVFDQAEGGTGPMEATLPAKEKGKK